MLPIAMLTVTSLLCSTSADLGPEQGQRKPVGIDQLTSEFRRISPKEIVLYEPFVFVITLSNGSAGEVRLPSDLFASDVPDLESGEILCALAGKAPAKAMQARYRAVGASALRLGRGEKTVYECVVCWDGLNDKPLLREAGDYQLQIKLPEWLRSSGSIGDQLVSVLAPAEKEGVALAKIKANERRMRFIYDPAGIWGQSNVAEVRAWLDDLGQSADSRTYRNYALWASCYAATVEARGQDRVQAARSKLEAAGQLYRQINGNILPFTEGYERLNLEITRQVAKLNEQQRGGEAAPR